MKKKPKQRKPALVPNEQPAAPVEAGKHAAAPEKNGAGLNAKR